MQFRATKKVGCNMLKGWNTHEYRGWHWNAKKRQTLRGSSKKKMERQTASARLSFHSSGPCSPTSVYCGGGGGGGGGITVLNINHNPPTSTVADF
jgi:hypothetical protein